MNVVRLDKQGGTLLLPAEQETVMQCVRDAFPGPILKNHDFRKSKSLVTVFPGKSQFRLAK